MIGFIEMFNDKHVSYTNDELDLAESYVGGYKSKKSYIYLRMWDLKAWSHKLFQDF